MQVNTSNYLDSGSFRLHELLEMGIEELNSNADNTAYVEDLVLDIADGLVPVYNADLLEIAKQDLSMGYMHQNSEEPAEDIFTLISQTIFHELHEALTAYAQELDNE